MSVKITEVSKKYGEQVAVNQITLSAEKGQILGFLGPNGAGKSTTMKMVTGFIPPDTGTIEVCGLEVSNHPIAIRQKIGYLPENNPLYLDMYVKEYLAFTGGIHKIQHIKSRIATSIEDVGLGAEQHKKIGQLSKGYKQRVGLAAAILHNPEVLILDEPTGGLDPNQLVEIRSLIKMLGKEKTIILSTHIMQEVEAMCDRVAIIHKGNLVANDSLVNLKHSNQQKKLKVGFEQALEQEWLRRLSAVQTVEKTNDGFWLLTGNDVESLRRQVVQFAADQQLNISSLQTIGGGLEEIFRSLTTTNP